MTKTLPRLAVAASASLCAFLAYITAFVLLSQPQDFTRVLWFLVVPAAFASFVWALSNAFAQSGRVARMILRLLSSVVAFAIWFAVSLPIALSFHTLLGGTL
jgi:hypothetical protein